MTENTHEPFREIKRNSLPCGGHLHNIPSVALPKDSEPTAAWRDLLLPWPNTLPRWWMIVSAEEAPQAAEMPLGFSDPQQERGASKLITKIGKHIFFN